MSLMDNESLVREEREPNNDENSSTWSIQLVGAFTFEPLSRVSEFGILHFKTMQISCCFINLDTVLHFWFSSTQEHVLQRAANGFSGSFVYNVDRFSQTQSGRLKVPVAISRHSFELHTTSKDIGRRNLVINSSEFRFVTERSQNLFSQLTEIFKDLFERAPSTQPEEISKFIQR